MIRKLCLWLVFVTVAHGGPAEAQTCLGRASFAVAPYQVSGGAAFTDGANAFEAGFAGGSQRVFAGATLGRTNYTDIDVSSTDVGGFIGGGPPSRGGTLQVCGLAGLNYTAGPSIGIVDTDAVSLGIGASIGIAAVDGPSYSIVPAFGGGITFAWISARAGGEDATELETFGTIDLGVGFVFNRRVSVTPRIAFPIGRDTNDPVFAITLGVNFGA